ncbi:hypothetical protein [Niallia circulans]|uniref:Uncharacterized protein n=1 Tax=Niallia circulans TaxID=1397 RepID=A0A941JL34_NIACI|nr:hypothetical protein [Niallia circulans]MCB5235476.1 hypothetical protein [Niallia circulans]
MLKNTQLFFEGFSFQIDYDNDNSNIIIRINDYVLDEESSKPFHSVFKENVKIEIYPEIDDLKEIVKVLQEVIDKEEEDGLSIC